MRFFLSTATFLTDAFFNTSPVAIAACTPPGGRRSWRRRRRRRRRRKRKGMEGPLPVGSPPHSLLLEAGEEDAMCRHQSCRQADTASCITRPHSVVLLVYYDSSKTHRRATYICSPSLPLSPSPSLSLFLPLSTSFLLHHRDVTGCSPIMQCDRDKSSQQLYWHATFTASICVSCTRTWVIVQVRQTNTQMSTSTLFNLYLLNVYTNIRYSNGLFNYMLYTKKTLIYFRCICPWKKVLYL